MGSSVRVTAGEIGHGARSKENSREVGAARRLMCYSRTIPGGGYTLALSPNPVSYPYCSTPCSDPSILLIIYRGLVRWFDGNLSFSRFKMGKYLAVKWIYHSHSYGMYFLLI
jgi:hypothetical protein